MLCMLRHSPHRCIDIGIAHCSPPSLFARLPHLQAAACQCGRRLRPEAAALDALPARLAAGQCGDEEQPQDVEALLLLYLSKHERKALEVAERRGRADLTARFGRGSVAQVQRQAVGEDEPAAAAAEVAHSGTPPRHRRHSSGSGGSPQPPSTLRRRQQQQQPDAERALGSPRRLSPAKSMR